MQLSEVVPWGRSFDEYCAMFNLSLTHPSNILSVADGPSSFNAEGTQQGLKITSCDPLYQHEPASIKTRIDEVYPIVMSQVEKSKAQFIWHSIKSPAELGQKRMSSMRCFLDDIKHRPQHYLNASLPVLPFDKHSFDLAVCSHFLFLYSEQLNYDFHLASILALCHVAKEVRIYPLVTLDNTPSPHLEKVLITLREMGFVAEKVAVDYQFQKSATHMLRVTQHD